MRTPEQIAYDICNRVDAPGWGGDVQAAIASAIRQAEVHGMEAALAVCDKRHGAKYAAVEIRELIAAKLAAIAKSEG